MDTNKYNDYQSQGQTSNGVNDKPTVEESFLRLVMLMISSVILSVAMLSGGYVALSVVFLRDKHTMDHLFPILLVVGLAYAVGWIVALVGIRLFHNLVLPFVMQLYAWLTFSGILILYLVILQKLFQQQYDMYDFGKYIAVVTATFLALLGFHLLPEEHNLRPFSVPLLIFNMGHLYLILYHYVFRDTVKFEKLGYDIFFFLFMTSISVFMLIRVGMLNWLRRALERLFEKRPDEKKRV